MPIIKKQGKELLWDLINEANPRAVPFSAENSALESITGGSFTVDGTAYNTRARVRGLPGTGYTGSQLVYYNRLTLPLLFLQNTPLNVESFSAADVHALLPVINRTYGLTLTTADINNATLSNPNVPSYVDGVNLTANSTTSALLTTGFVRLTYRRGLPYLDKFIIDKNLLAYTHPVTDASVKSAQMLTYGIDFTDSKNLLLVDGTGMPNFDALQQILTQTYGLPAWDAPLNSNYVTDNPTSAVTNANQKFDRVVVQTGISNDKVVGFAYYHYMN